LPTQPTICYKVDAALTSDPRKLPMRNPLPFPCCRVAAEVILCRARKRIVDAEDAAIDVVLTANREAQATERVFQSGFATHLLQVLR
jgi:hypothetical protein